MTLVIPAADGEGMTLSKEGLRLVKSFEGYHRRLRDGSCIAYQCPAGVWTLGYGCTVGIKPGMQWTEAEAEEALHGELARFESAVRRLVKVDLNQNEFDALVSFAYNCGEGALAKSTILRRLNAGDRVGAAKAFHAWNKGGGRVLPGLVSRRAREAALFLKPVAAPDEPIMPQAVGKASPTLEAVKTLGAARAVGTVAAGGAGATVAASPDTVSNVIPSVPSVITDNMSNAASWKGVGSSLWTSLTSIPVEPLPWLIGGALLAIVWLWPRKKVA